MANNTETTTNQNELVEYKEIKGTPFTAVRQEEKWYLHLGRFRLTEELKSEEECKKASKLTWERVIQVAHIIAENNDTTIKLKNEIFELKNDLHKVEETIN